MFRAVVAISLRRAATVAQAMCGVMMQFLAAKSGLSAGIGSRAATSRAAPAITPPFRAQARSCSFTSPPREVLTRSAWGCIRASRAAFTIPSFSAFSGQCRLTTSALAKSSSSSSQVTAIPSGATLRRGLQARISIPSALAMTATRAPMRPSPTIPIDLPQSSVSGCATRVKSADRDHSPRITASWYRATRLVSSKRRAMACCATESLPYSGTLTTGMPSSAACSRSTTL